MAGGLGVLYGKDPLNLAIEDQISFAAQVGIIKMIIMLMMQSLPSLMMVVFSVNVHPLKTALDFSTLGVMVIGDLSSSIWTIMPLGKPSIPVPYSKPFSWRKDENQNCYHR